MDAWLGAIVLMRAGEVASVADVDDVSGPDGLFEIGDDRGVQSGLAKASHHP